jgi:glutaredoxin
VALTLLTRDGCSLCRTAHTELTRICTDLGLEFDEVDVDRLAADGDAALRAEFGDRLPVVLLDGEEHSYWEVDEPRLRADLATRRAAGR